jgi:ubiquinone/menaquinone biosynthesis C-methylase UbiE
MQLHNVYLGWEKLMRGTSLTRRLRSRLLYPMLTGIMRRSLPSPTQFLNYGYAPLPGDNTFQAPGLLPKDEPDRLSIQLYHQVTHAYVANCDVLEVSCGHGGGAAYLARYLHPRSVLGMDINPAAITFCCSHYLDVPNLSFQVGDAEQLPLHDQSVDVVVNIEASHCYGSMAKFLHEVRRVLRPGGYLLFADFRPAAQKAALEALFGVGGFQICAQCDLTPNIVAALQSDNERKLGLLTQGPQWLSQSLAEFSCMEGTDGYRSLANRAELYMGYTLQAG